MSGNIYLPMHPASNSLLAKYFPEFDPMMINVCMGRRGGGQGLLAGRGGLAGYSPERRKCMCRDGEGGTGVAGLGTMRSIV